jgi:hypothetical protein
VYVYWKVVYTALLLDFFLHGGDVGILNIAGDIVRGTSVQYMRMKRPCRVERA